MGTYQKNMSILGEKKSKIWWIGSFFFPWKILCIGWNQNFQGPQKNKNKMGTKSYKSYNVLKDFGFF